MELNSEQGTAPVRELHIIAHGTKEECFSRFGDNVSNGSSSIDSARVLFQISKKLEDDNHRETIRQLIKEAIGKAKEAGITDKIFYRDLERAI